MPRDYLWDVADYVPLVVDAGLTGRGGWVWGSDVMGGDPVAGILGSFTSGDKLLVIGADARWYEVNYTTNAVTPKTAVAVPKQNPVQATNMVISFDAAGTTVPQMVTYPGGTFTQAAMDASAPKAPVGCAYHEYIAVGGVTGSENIVYFSYPGQPAHAWDALSNKPTARAITAMAALRAVILVFHAGAVSRIRGSTPPHAGATDDDMIEEGLFDRVGCSNPLTISYWNDNCVFADEHGVHVTDGAVIRNLASQGGILTYWRMLYANQISMAACTFLDFYWITVRRSDGSATTLICDLNRRQWFRFANIYALSYIASSGGGGMERIWAGMAGTKRLGRVSPCFFPVTDATATIADADGKPVLPTLETPWYRTGREGHKRQRFVHLSYDARNASTQALMDLGFVTSPMDANYLSIGQLPPTTRYSRYKLPINRGSYGIAFKVAQLAPTSVTRIYDLAIEGWPLEPSR
jgi:hypothetical protein